MAEKSYILQQRNTRNFFKNIKASSENSLSFENCSIFDDYVNPDIKEAIISDKNLQYIKNVLLDKHLHDIKAKCTIKHLTATERKEYENDPFNCAYNEVGYTDFWWLILAVNNCTSVHEFTNLSSIMIPDAEQINEILTVEFSRDYADKIGFK